jgi:hypothetical protein
LAKRMKAMNWAYTIDQDKLDIGKAINECANFVGLGFEHPRTRFLSRAVDEVVL